MDKFQEHVNMHPYSSRKDDFKAGMLAAAEIAENHKVGANKFDDITDRVHDQACNSIATTIKAKAEGL